jgi:hypothetical protein
VASLADAAATSVGLLSGQPVHRFEHGNATGEHGIACSVEHAHQHLLPADVDVIDALQRLGGWVTVHADDSPWVASRGREYLLYRPPGASECWVRVQPTGEHFTSQLLRRVFATALGKEDWWNWRAHPDAATAHETYVAVANHASAGAAH